MITFWRVIKFQKQKNSVPKMCDRNATIDWINGLLLNGVPIPEEIVTIILSYIDPKRILIISTVCKNWCKIVRSYTFWNDKYRRKCGHQAKQVPWYVFYCLFTRKYFINSLTNCNGENGFNGWCPGLPIIARFKIEDVPPTNVPECREFVRCFATSRNFCIKFQTIHLEHDFLLLKVVGMVHPRILLTDWVTAGIDTEINYASNVKLFGPNGRMIYQSIVDCEVEKFENSWVKLQRVIEDYPSLFKSIRFEHLVHKRGICDGDSGIKIAGTVVKFDFECINLNVS